MFSSRSYLVVIVIIFHKIFLVIAVAGVFEYFVIFESTCFGHMFSSRSMIIVGGHGHGHGSWVMPVIDQSARKNQCLSQIFIGLNFSVFSEGIWVFKVCSELQVEVLKY